MVATVTSYNNATPGSGTALNQCAVTYNTFAQLSGIRKGDKYINVP
jgi:hypothetical protein